jgi:hypothetical protein
MLHHEIVLKADLVAVGDVHGRFHVEGFFAHEAVIGGSEGGEFGVEGGALGVLEVVAGRQVVSVEVESALHSISFFPSQLLYLRLKIA